MVPKCVTVVTFGGSEVKIRGSSPGPILLPSVAPEGTPPAMLLKQLAFGIRSFLAIEEILIRSLLFIDEILITSLLFIEEILIERFY